MSKHRKRRNWKGVNSLKERLKRKDFLKRCKNLLWLLERQDFFVGMKILAASLQLPLLPILTMLYKSNLYRRQHRYRHYSNNRHDSPTKYDIVCESLFFLSLCFYIFQISFPSRSRRYHFNSFPKTSLVRYK